MIYVLQIRPPQEYTQGDRSLFLAGTITGTSDWQHEMVDLLRNENLVILNPRRDNFPINQPNAAEEQIRWEYRHLRKADAVSFWFARETLGPIVLYELGAWSTMQKPIFVGVHPEYLRKLDVEIQTSLARPEVKIVNDLRSLAEQVRSWTRG